ELIAGTDDEVVEGEAGVERDGRGEGDGGPVDAVSRDRGEILLRGSDLVNHFGVIQPELAHGRPHLIRILLLQPLAGYLVGYGDPNTAGILAEESGPRNPVLERRATQSVREPLFYLFPN